ncbi:MAG: hypothetical protein JWP85_1124 [Rhodoglobus sp.]|nr:hypothetical protein [Rhodoglobus sp.]
MGEEKRASEVAYDAILDQIISLKLAPGSVLNEHATANELELGRMPVREAIARLATDRFVTVLPRRGAIVAPLGLDDVLDMFEAREAIECGVAYIVARTATAEDLATFRTLVEAADRQRAGTNYENFLRDDHAIHAFLVHMVRNPLLQDAADRLLLHNIRFWRMYWSSRPAQPSTMMSHAPLVAALEAHDSSAAAKAMREHLAASRQLVQASF